MEKLKDKKKFENCLKDSNASISNNEIKSNNEFVEAIPSNNSKIKNSLWNFLTNPELQKVPANFVETNTYVDSNTSISDIPTARELIEEGNLTHRQKSLFFLSNMQIASLLFSPKALVRDETIVDDKILYQVKGFDMSYCYNEKIYLTPSMTDSKKIDVLVLSKKLTKIYDDSKPEEVSLTLYPNADVTRAVSIFRFDAEKTICHSSKRFVGKKMYPMNYVKGSHFHTITEEEELFHEVSLNVDFVAIKKTFDKTRVFGKWFASKIEMNSGYPVDTAREFLYLCENDFNFGNDMVEIDEKMPIKDFNLTKILGTTQIIPPKTNFRVIYDRKTVDFIKRAVYHSSLLGNNPVDSKPYVSLGWQIEKKPSKSEERKNKKKEWKFERSQLSKGV